MPRTRMVFDRVFGLPPAEPPYSLDYHSLPDRGLTEVGLEARRAKEAARMEGLRRTIPRISSLAALHRWLFTGHRACAAGADPRSDAPPAAALDNREKAASEKPPARRPAATSRGEPLG